MRFCEVLVAIALFMGFSICFTEYSIKINKLNEECIGLEKQVTAEKFISNSFVNTCSGKGFADLNEWQQKCRAMYNLDYIAWCNAEDFMDVSYENKPTQLYYGTWNSNDIKGEIYCRKRIAE